jgi:4-hydroxy-3-polyprenylbenzoate decarboxylase
MNAMNFSSLQHCVQHLENQGELIRVTEQVDPDLEMAQITRRVFEAKGPALLFTTIKGTNFPAVSNLFGTWERTLKIFEPQLESVKALIDLKSNPELLVKKPKTLLKMFPALTHALPIRVGKAKVMENRCDIQDLPMIKCWPQDGGAFVLLPQVFSNDPDKSSILSSNMGMYRIQISGNDYDFGKEIGLHYQLHRGIGNHHKKALEKKQTLKVSIFIGGPPAHTLAAVMPLPENVPEVAFAGALAGRNFRYARKNGFTYSSEADFCITGILVPGKTKKEGPFGDHLGYYSLAHEYPYLKVVSVHHRKGAIFPFTVVGRPPQEDSNFGCLIHEMTRSAVRDTLPGVTAVNAVDDAGVHPLLLVKAHERYVPFEKRTPKELLTHANMVLGTGQLSLAKYLFICAHEDNPDLNVNDEKEFFIHMLERIDFASDFHFWTKTTMDTLDYSSQKINQGSKLVIAVASEKKRRLATQISGEFSLPDEFKDPRIVTDGIIAVRGPLFKTYASAKIQVNRLKKHLQPQPELETLPMLVIVDDSEFCARSFANFLWISFLRSNPSHDIYGVNEKIEFKHWGCTPPFIIDARRKPFHADPLEPDKKTIDKVNDLAKKGGSLSGII